MTGIRCRTAGAGTASQPVPLIQRDFPALLHVAAQNGFDRLHGCRRQSNAGAVAEGLGWSEDGHWRENGSKRLDLQGGAPDAERIPGVRGMQRGLNSVSMAMGVMEKALYSFYTRISLGS